MKSYLKKLSDSKYFEELNQILVKYKLKKNDICLFGGVVLFVHGIREPNDLDICLKPSARERILKEETGLEILSNETICFTENTHTMLNRYKDIGLNDDEIFEKELYEDIEGYKIIPLEIEFCHKAFRGRPHDNRDLPEITKYAVNSKDWNWELLAELYSRRCKITQSKKREPVITLPANPTQSLKNQLILKIPTAFLLGNQFIDAEFVRYDILLRYLTAKSINDGDEKFVPYYKKMQLNRIKQDTEIEFRSLIKSIKENGFLSRYPIPIEEDGMLRNGAHRFACALCFEMSEIPVVIDPDTKKTYYGRPWFVEKEFGQDLVETLDKTKDMLLEKFGVWFSVILWPPAEPFFDEIREWLKENYNVKWEKRLKLENNFADFTREIYAIDDIDEWKVELKINAMKKYNPNVLAFAVEIPKPDFVAKKLVQASFSQEGADLKAKVRNKYKNLINNYIYDIICHTGDNYEHNKEVFRIINKYGQ